MATHDSEWMVIKSVEVLKIDESRKKNHNDISALPLDPDSDQIPIQPHTGSNQSSALSLTVTWWRPFLRPYSILISSATFRESVLRSWPIGDFAYSWVFTIIIGIKDEISYSESSILLLLIYYRFSMYTERQPRHKSRYPLFTDTCWCRPRPVRNIIAWLCFLELRYHVITEDSG